jgi:hypothetical protein
MYYDSVERERSKERRKSEKKRVHEVRSVFGFYDGKGLTITSLPLIPPPHTHTPYI